MAWRNYYAISIFVNSAQVMMYGVIRSKYNIRKRSASAPGGRCGASFGRDIQGAYSVTATGTFRPRCRRGAFGVFLLWNFLGSTTHQRRDIISNGRMRRCWWCLVAIQCAFTVAAPGPFRPPAGRFSASGIGIYAQNSCTWGSRAHRR